MACIDVLSTCMSVYHMHVLCLRRLEEGIGSTSPGVGVTGFCELLRGCWEWNLGPLREQPVLSTAVPVSPDSQRYLVLGAHIACVPEM